MKEIERWLRISDDLIDAVKQYLKINNIKVQDLAKELKMPYYALNKILDKKIKMTMKRTFFIKLANHINAPFVVPFEINPYKIN